MMNTTVNGNSQYKDWLIMDCYSGSDVGGGVAFGVNRQSLGAYIMRSEAARMSWSQSAELYGTHNANKSTVAWACSSLSASGNIVGSGQVAAGSDIRWKVNIAPVRPNVIDCLNPVEWDWKEGHGKGHSAGLVAQQVARILPFAVMGNEADGYVLNYNVFHAYEIAELQSLRRRVAELERKLNIF